MNEIKEENSENNFLFINFSLGLYCFVFRNTFVISSVKDGQSRASIHKLRLD